MSKFYDPYFPTHLSPKPNSSTSKLQEYKQRYKTDNFHHEKFASDVFKSVNSPGETYLTPSSLKFSEKIPSSSESRSSLNALKALQGKIKTLENIIEMKDKEKEIIIKNYQDLTEKIRMDLEMIRSVEMEMRNNLKQTEEESVAVRLQLERELDVMAEKFQQKSQEVQVLNLRLEEKNEFIHESLSELKQENSSLKSNNDRLNILNQSLNREIDELQNRLKELEDINKNLSQRSADFQKETFSIKNSYDQAIDKYKQEFKQYQESNQEKIEANEVKIEEIADEKRGLENELKEQRMHNDVLQKEIDSKDIEIMRLKQRTEIPILSGRRDKSKGNNSNFDKNGTLVTLKEEIEIDKQELEKNKSINHTEFTETYLKKYTSPNRNISEGNNNNYNNNNNNNNNNAIIGNSKTNNYTYNKTLKSIKELDKEITQMNQEYQDLLVQSQSTKQSKDKEGVRQKIFYLSEMLRDATSKMYTLKNEEDLDKK